MLRILWFLVDIFGNFIFEYLGWGYIASWWASDSLEGFVLRCAA